MAVRHFFLSLLLIMFAVPAWSQDDPAAKEVAELVMAFNKAYAANDLDTYFSYYSDDATGFFNTDRIIVSDYEVEWRDAVADGLAVLEAAVDSLSIRMAPNGDSAVATYDATIKTRQVDGTVENVEAKETDILFKINGNWKVVHVNYTWPPAE